MNENSTIKVIDKISQEIIKTYSLDESHLAYEFASQLEEIGMDIEIKSPTLVESFKNALELNSKQIDEYDESVREEVEDHDGQELTDDMEVDSCCFKPFQESKD